MGWSPAANGPPETRARLKAGDAVATRGTEGYEAQATIGATHKELVLVHSETSRLVLSQKIISRREIEGTTGSEVSGKGERRAPTVPMSKGSYLCLATQKLTGEPTDSLPSGRIVAPSRE